MENVLVAGANGKTGKEVVNLLKSSQYFNPIAMIRKEEQTVQFKSQGIDTVLADLTKDLTSTVNGVDKVIFAAGSGGENVVEVDQEGAKRLIAVSKMANVKKFVMLSSMGADNPDEAEELKDYLKAKHKADEHLRHSGLKYTIVRSGTLNDTEGTSKIELKEKLNKQGEISRSDVAQTLVRALHDDAETNITFEIVQGDILIAEAMNQLEAKVN